MVLPIPDGGSMVLFMVLLLAGYSLFEAKSSEGALGLMDPTRRLKFVSSVEPPTALVRSGVPTLVMKALPPGINFEELTARRSAPAELISLPFLKNFLEDISF